MTEPTSEWEYRNIRCRVYVLNEIGEIGYVRIGDVWAQVHEEDHETKSARSFVEEAIDDIIGEAVSYTEDDETTLPPVNPRNPSPPDPDGFLDEYDPCPFEDDIICDNTHGDNEEVKIGDIA